MSGTIPPATALLDGTGYLARVTLRDHRAIEEALAGTTLLTEGPNLRAVVVEATYAAGEPPLLRRLREDRITQIVEPQSLRFTGQRFLEVEALASLPYAPERPILISDFGHDEAVGLARGALVFQQQAGADIYMAPGFALPDGSLDRWLDANDLILRAACAANGGADIDRKPLLALVAPGAKALAQPELVARRLLDSPIDGVYVQALRLNPVADSLEKLARFVQFVHTLQALGLPVIVGRVGAFGLVLQALGIDAFDSGLGQAEAHDLASLNRRLSDRQRKRREEGERGGGPTRRVYLEPLKTTFNSAVSDAIIADEALRHRFTCTKSCCRFRGFEELASRARQHYLWTRLAEVDALSAAPVPAMRMASIESHLHQARDLAILVKRSLEARDIKSPNLSHLDRWLGLLAREQQLAAAA